MIRHVGIATVCFVVAMAFGTAMAEEGPSTQAQVGSEIHELELKWIQADMSGDGETLRSILHEDFLASSLDRAPIDREAYIAQFSGNTERQGMSQDLSDRHVVVNGDTAVVLLNDTIRGTNEGKPFSAVMRLTVTWVKRDGRWQALAMHSHVLPPPGSN